MDEVGSFTGVAVVTGAPTRPALGLVVAVGAEWGAGVAETTARLWLVVITRSQRVRGLEAGTVKTGPSTTPPEPGTEVKPAVRVRSMKKSPKEGGRGAQRLAVRVVQVTSVTQTRKTTRNPTPRTAPITPTPPAAATFHLHHPEVHRPGSSPPGAYPQGGAGVEAAEEETCTGVVETLEEPVEDTESDPAPLPTAAPPSSRHRCGSSKPRHNPPGPKTRTGGETAARRRTRCLMEVKLKVRGPIPLSHLCPQLLPPRSPPRRTVGS